MKWTGTHRTAMLRLAEALGWDVESKGKRWRVVSPSVAPDLTYTSTALLSYMTRVAMSPLEWKGENMSGPEMRELIRFKPRHVYDPKRDRWDLALAGTISATDEATLYSAYFHPEVSDG